MKLLALPAAVLLAGTLVLGLAACGGSSSTPTVASVPTTASAPHSPSTAASSPAGGGSDDSGPAAGRPQFRLDDTDARRSALIEAYNSCLITHGATAVDESSRVTAVQAAGEDGKVGIVAADPVPAKARAACLHMLPLMPPEVEASTNPDFHEQSLAYVGCLRQHGEWVQLLNNHDLDWTYVEGHPVPQDNGRIEHDCELEAFGGTH